MDPKIPEVWASDIQSTSITFSRGLLYSSFALLAVLVSWYQWKRSKIDKMIESIPGPPVWPITGNAHMFLGLDMEGVCDKMVELMKRYGSTIRFWLGPFLWINLAEPNDLEKILTSEFTTNKDPTYRFFKDHGVGLFTASGEEWKKLRKIANPSFNQKILESFVETFNEQGNILVKVLESKVGQPTFDVGEWVSRCTLDIFCGTQMNVKTKEQTEDTSDFSGYLKKSLAIVKMRFYKLHLQSDLVYKMTEMGKRNKHNVKHMHDFVQNVVAERRRIRKLENETMENDALVEQRKRSVYLDTMLDHFSHLSDYETAFLTTDVVIAGADTTSVSISFTLMLLGTYTDIQEKLYKEIMEVVGDNDITHADLPKLVYLDMVLKEVLRHFTVPAIVRKLDKDTSLGHVTLPSGTSVQLCLYAVHRDPRYWSHPDDFYPDHFLPENVAKRPKFSFIPFSMGPRNCPGYAFALMSMKTVVATFLRSYKVSSDVDLKNMQFNNYFMLEPKQGYLLQISKR